MKFSFGMLLLLVVASALAGCEYVHFPPGTDPTYCHMNYKFVKQGYYPPPEQMPKASAASTPYPYAFPRRFGSGPQSSVPSPAPLN